MALNENDLTIGDLEDFEDVAGVSFEEAFKKREVVTDDDGKPVLDDKGAPVSRVSVSPKIMKAITWIVKRHENPDFTLDDARNVKIGELEDLLEFGNRTDPTGAAD